MSLPVHSTLRLVRNLSALLAVLAFLLHTAALAHPVPDGGHHGASAVVDVALGAEAHAGGSGCLVAFGDSLCCEAACSATLLPLSHQVAGICTGHPAGAEVLQSGAGIVPEGIRRPPRSQA